MKKSVFIICFIAFSITAFTQSVGINNNAPHGTAILDITSINKGMLVPRMNTAQRTGIGLPATGLLVLKEMQKQEQTLDELKAALDEMKNLLAVQQKQLDELKK